MTPISPTTVDFLFFLPSILSLQKVVTFWSYVNEAILCLPEWVGDAHINFSFSKDRRYSFPVRLTLFKTNIVSQKFDHRM